MIVHLDRCADNSSAEPTVQVSVFDRNGGYHHEVPASIVDFADSFKSRPKGNQVIFRDAIVCTSVRHGQAGYLTNLGTAAYYADGQWCGFGAIGLQRALEASDEVSEVYHGPHPYEAAVCRLLDAAKGSENWHGYQGVNVKSQGSGYQVMVDGKTVFHPTYAKATAAVSAALVAYYASDRYRREREAEAKRTKHLRRPGRKVHVPVGWYDDSGDEQLAAMTDVASLHR